VVTSSPGSSLQAGVAASAAVDSTPRIYTWWLDLYANLGPQCCAVRATLTPAMAARSSGINLRHRGATTGQGAEVQREDLAPSPSSMPVVSMIDSLEETSGGLGTFRARL